ncbi:MAG: BamA/TamA family outer membrane protein [Sphingomonadales bacterium]|nr:BamA/TamA family outer membrane protein [Sphingomonadales bacterium]
MLIMPAMLMLWGAGPAWAQAGQAGQASAATSPAGTTAPTAASDDAELRALIPDEARSHPEDWARKPSPSAQSPAQATQPLIVPPSNAPAMATPQTVTITPPEGAPLSAKSPLSDMAGFSLGWPQPDVSLPPLDSLPQDADAIAALASLTRKDDTEQAAIDHATAAIGRHGMPLHYVLEWSARIPEEEALETRFRALSTLEAVAVKDQELPQVAVRAITDRQMLERLLRIYGYYDAEVLQTSDAAEPGQAGANAIAPVHFEILPGARYRFGAVETGHLVEVGAQFASLRKSLGIETGDPLHADAIPEGTSRLDTALGEAGYPFAKIGEPALTVDHTREEGDLTLDVTPGGQYRFGKIVSGDPHFLSPGHLQDIARFKPGQTYKRSEVDDFRRAMLATGLLSAITVTPKVERPSTPDTPGTVDLDVAMKPAPLRTIATELGYDTAEGVRLAVSWEHRNLFPPEGMLRLRGIAGTDEQLAGVTFRRSNFLGRDRVLTVDIYADNANLTAYAARKVAFATTYERQTNLLFQKPWVWSLGLQSEISDEREGVPSGITTGRTQYITTALPLRAAFDATDNLLDPHQGWRMSLRVSPEIAFARGDRSTYASIQWDASAYHEVAKSMVLAGRIRLGSITAGNLNDVAPSRRLYAGGGGSIRGYGYELVGPRNDLGEPKGGRSLYEVSLEARINTGWLGGNFQIVPFLDGGNVDETVLPSFRDMRFGTGLGVRYKTSFGPIRLDIGTPINPHPGDGPVAVYVALGQSF